jgi:exodeoxyribonuclease VII small subunit
MAKKSSKSDLPAEAATSAGPAAAEPTFEEALQRLEQIVHELEEGQIGLDEALARYEEGVHVLRRCHDLLEGAQRRIELLSGVDAEGNPVTQPLDHAATFAAEQPGQGPQGGAGCGSRRAGDETSAPFGDEELGTA